MILDNLDQVMAAYAPTTGATNLQSYIDRLVAMENAAGYPLFGYVNVNTTALASGGAAEVEFLLLGNASDPTFASGNVTLATSGAIAKASLVKGYQISLAMSHAAFGSLEAKTAFLRYLTIVATITTHDLTAGKFDAWLGFAPMPSDNLSYPAGYSV